MWSLDTKDAICVVKRMQQKHGSKGMKLCYETGRKVVRELWNQSLSSNVY